MKFDAETPNFRISDAEILAGLRDYGALSGKIKFTTADFNSWSEKPCRSETVIKRFSTWNDALIQGGFKEGAQKHKYTPEELIENLRDIWLEIGRKPGKRKLPNYGRKISERPYINVWGSVERACRMLADYENGKINEADLLTPKGMIARRSIPLSVRWKVLKSGKYKCDICGRTPSNSNVELHIDHIVPVSRGGGDHESNLRVLCDQCNLGRSNRVD